MPDIDKNIQKEAVKEALQEWLDKQFAMLGKWTLGGICSIGLAVLVYLWLSSQGWHK
jgi:hypothetical protein